MLAHLIEINRRDRLSARLLRGRRLDSALAGVARAAAEDQEDGGSECEKVRDPERDASGEMPEGCTRRVDLFLQEPRVLLEGRKLAPALLEPRRVFRSELLH